jgi:RecA/RadA recombinase
MTPELKKALGAALKKTPTLVRNLDTYETLKRIPLDSPQLTYMFSGGLPYGRIHNFFGQESGGKSTIVTYLCSQLQKYMPENQKTILYLDFERSFGRKFAENIGLDCSDERLIYSTPNSIEEAIDLACALIETGNIAGVVLDSDAAAPTKTQMIDNFGKACVAPNTKVEYWVE